MMCEAFRKLRETLPPPVRVRAIQEVCVTKQDHLKLQEWLVEIHESMEEAQRCLNPCLARALVLAVASELEFLGGNMAGGTIQLNTGEKVSTSQMFKDVAKVLGNDAEGVHLRKMTKAFGELTDRHRRHTATLPDVN